MAGAVRSSARNTPSGLILLLDDRPAPASPARHTGVFEGGRMGRIVVLLSFVLSLGVAVVLVAQAPATYHITHTYTLGGDGRWDYFVPDPPQHRQFPDLS